MERRLCPALCLQLIWYHYWHQVAKATFQRCEWLFISLQPLDLLLLCEKGFIRFTTACSKDTFDISPCNLVLVSFCLE